MTFDETLLQVTTLLQHQRRIAYRSLKRRFGLDDEEVEDIKAELIDAKRVAIDENDKVLVWAGKPQHADDPMLSQTPSPPERRQLTVMFCDLVSSTPLAEQLDPEDFRDVVQAYQILCEQQAHSLDGYVALYMGDGILFYFGYPIAYEDAAARAIRTGLRILAALPTLNAQLCNRFPILTERPLQVRIGIHTGLVVVGEMGGSDYRAQVALGETPNIAARVQGIAAPNTVAISAKTHQLVAGLFECRELGRPLLKGVSNSVLVYQVLSEGEAQSRFDVVRQTGLPALVGRTEELNILQRRWSQAKSGTGQVVWLDGEAGIGKSRLVHGLRDHTSHERATCLEFRCDPYHQHTALYPVVRLLERVFQFQREDSSLQKFEKLKQALAGYRFPRADTVLLLAELLSVPLPAGVPALTLSPEKKRQRTQENLIGWIFEEAEQQPTLCVCEDLQWADPSTLTLLDLCLPKLASVPMLLLLTSRPEFVVPWQDKEWKDKERQDNEQKDTHQQPHHTQLTLRRLAQPASQALIEQIAGGRSLPGPVLQHILIQTDGVPLFIEELTKTVVESEVLQDVNGRYELTRPLATLDIPATLHDSLMARLDRLAAKDLAQIGAALGREFSYELIQAVSTREEVSLQQGLQQLCQAGLIYQRGTPPHATYFFKHALIQETAYQSLLKRTRQDVHYTSAQILEERFPEITETQPEFVAHHYTQAGRIQQAIPYWRQAGERANTRAAHTEAIQHAQTGLDLVSSLPEDAERDQLELDLQVLLGGSLSSNYGAPEVERTYRRARELCQRLGETKEIFPVLRGLATFYMMRGNQTVAQDLSEQCMRFAHATRNSLFQIEACVALGFNLFYRGKLEAARTTLEQGVQLYSEIQEKATPVFFTPQDPGVACLSLLPWVLWLLGYPDQATQRHEEALHLAQRLGQPFNVTYALIVGSSYDVLRQEKEEAMQHAVTALQTASEHGLSTWSIAAKIQLGSTKAARGESAEALDLLTENITAWRALGLELTCPFHIASLAQAYRTAGQLDKALASITEALQHAEQYGERWYDAECYRLRGEYALAQSADQDDEADDEAEADWLQVIEIARSQQAKSLELRAAVSLSRLWQRQGKKTEASALLCPIYAWFSEGFDSEDLRYARALLAELED